MNRRIFLKYIGGAVAVASLPLSLAGAKAKTVAVAGKVPYIFLLQPLSPHIEGVKGARAGMLMLSDTKTDKVFNSIEFVPCHAQDVYHEWRNRQGTTDSGFHASSKLVGVHKWNSDVIRAAKAKFPQVSPHITDSGNRLIETHNLFGLMVDGDEVVTRCMISFTGSRIKVYKSFLNMVYWSDTRFPMFAHKLRISSVRKPCRAGDFYNYQIEPASGSWIRTEWGSVDVADSLTHPDHPFIEAGSEFANQLREADNEQA